jgi:hypothetical protein
VVKARHGFVSAANRARAENHGRASLTSLRLTWEGKKQLGDLLLGVHISYRTGESIADMDLSKQVCNADVDSQKNRAHRPQSHNERAGKDGTFGGNKASNEHLTKSYTKPQLALSPCLPSLTHAHTRYPLPIPMGEKEKGNVQMLREKAPLHLWKKRARSISVVSGKKSLPLAQAICSRAKKVRTIVLEVRRLVRLSLFSSALAIITHLYRYRIMRCSLVGPGKRTRQRLGENLRMSR